MKTYFVSDLHLDHYVTRHLDFGKMCTQFDQCFPKMFYPAERLCIAGDIANDPYIYVDFVKYIATKYSEVVIVFGNHDLDARIKNVMVLRWMNTPYFDTTNAKLEFIRSRIRDIPNVHLLEGTVHGGIGGTMGMCDFDYMFNQHATREYNIRHWRSWYDNNVWIYMGNDPLAILADEQAKIETAIASGCSVMMTHFVPTQCGVAPMYKEDSCTPFFMFDADKYFVNMPAGSIWHCGHTHDAWKTEYEDSVGKKHLILCNPYGYPNEKPLVLNSLEKADFVIDV